MIVIMKHSHTEGDISAAKKIMEAGGVNVMISKGAETTILGAEGNADYIDTERLTVLSGVEKVMRVSEPFKKANRKYHPDDTEIKTGSFSVGGNNISLIAGPCSVESEEQIVGIAEDVKKIGATALRVGAYKPRSCPLRRRTVDYTKAV